MDRRAAVRAELAAELATTRAAFHALLEARTDADLRQPSRNPGWTNGEVLWHMVFGFVILAALAPLVRVFGRIPRRYSKRFARLLNSATGVFNRVNAWGARGGARVYTRRRIGPRFDRAYAAVLRLVETAGDDEWALGMHYPTRWDRLFHDYMTLEDICRYPMAHFNFHLDQIAPPSGARTVAKRPRSPGVLPSRRWQDEAVSRGRSMPPCPRCAGTEVKKDGKVGETQRYRCRACRRTFIARTGTPFAGHRWPQEVIVTAVRWYLRFSLSAADVRDLLAERGVDVSARTVLHWVQKFAPLLARAGRRAATRPGARWWCDETYVRVGGKWAYLYRAIDEAGQVVDVLLRARRDLDSARAFFVLATYHRRATPDEIITDKHSAYVRAVREEVPGAMHTRSGLHRASGPETKSIERSHVPTKDRLRPMRGLQSIRTGQRAIEGVELARAVQRGHVAAPAAAVGVAGPHARARDAATTFTWLADSLRVAA